MIASVIKKRRRKRSGRKGKENGREDVLVISETHLRQDYIKENRSGLQRGERGGGEMGEGVGGGRNWMRSRRPRGVDLDCHDLTAEAQQMRCVCVRVRACVYVCAHVCMCVPVCVHVCRWIFLCTDLCGCTKKCVDVCETKTDKWE